MFSHFFNLILGNDSVSTTLRVSKHRIFTVFIRKCACMFVHKNRDSKLRQTEIYKLTKKCILYGFNSKFLVALLILLVVFAVNYP